MRLRSRVVRINSSLCQNLVTSFKYAVIEWPHTHTSSQTIFVCDIRRNWDDWLKFTTKFYMIGIIFLPRNMSILSAILIIRLFLFMNKAVRKYNYLQKMHEVKILTVMQVYVQFHKTNKTFLKIPYERAPPVGQKGGGQKIKEIYKWPSAKLSSRYNSTKIFQIVPNAAENGSYVSTQPDSNRDVFLIWVSIMVIMQWILLFADRSRNGRNWF